MPVHAASSARPQRLAPTDLAVLWPEDHGWPQDVGVLGILDASALQDADGRLRVDVVRHHLATRIDSLPPRFRKRLVRPPFGLGGPYWVDVDEVDLSAHVRETAVPAPGDEAALLDAAEQVRREGLDPHRPRWRLTFFTGLDAGRAGLLVQVHHCLVDGVSGVAALAAFVDPPPGAGPAPQSVPSRQPAPSRGALVADALRRRGRALVRLADTAAHPARSAARLRADLDLWRTGMADRPAPPTSLNAAPIGPGRRLALVRGDLRIAKVAAHAAGGTVNDVLLTAVAGGLRALLAARGEPVDGVVLRAAVPVALHGSGGRDAEGNADGGLIVDLPVGEADAHVRLRRIAAHTAERKRHAIMPGATRGLFATPGAQRLLIRLTAHQHRSNTYVANVAGPPQRLSLGGAPVLELFPVVPLLGNISVGVGALSYAGQLNITVMADRDACPDLDVVAAGIRHSLDALVTATRRA